MKNPNDTTTSKPIAGKRLWFGFAGAAAAWAIAGFLNVLFSGQSCSRAETSMIIPAATWLRVLLAIMTLFLLAVAIGAGITSLRNWRSSSRLRDFISAEGRGRQEFMAMFGVLVSVTLGLGIVWFFLPIFIIRMCVRAH